MKTYKELLEKYSAFNIGVHWDCIQKFEEEGELSNAGLGPDKGTDQIDSPNTVGRSVLFPLVKKLFPSGGEVAMELGCGFGNQTVPLCEVFKNVYGFDQSTSKIRRAQLIFPTVTFGACDVIYSKWDENFSNVDLVQTITFLQHIQFAEKITILLKINKVLRMGGHLIMFEGRVTSEPGPDEQSKRQSHMFAMPVQLLNDIFEVVSIDGSAIVCRKVRE